MKNNNLSYFFLFLIIFLNFSSSKHSTNLKKNLIQKNKQFFPQEKGNIITIYYEPLSPESIVFFNSSLKRFYKSREDFISSGLVKKIELIPGGMMKYNSNSDFKKYSLSCPRGLNECEANKYHICALNLYDKEKSNGFIFCYFKNILKRHYSYNNEETCKLCSLLNRMDFRILEKCVNNVQDDETKGENYLVQMVEDRNKLKQRIKSVPWVLVNNYYEAVRGKQFETNMLDGLCKYFQYHSLLPVCQLIK